MKLSALFAAAVAAAGIGVGFYGQSLAKDPAQVYTDVKRYTVEVEVQLTDSGPWELAGTGFLLHCAKPTAMTANHVVSIQDGARYRIKNAAGVVWDVDYWKPADRTDCAVLTPHDPKKNWGTDGLDLAYNDPKVGDTIYMVGHPCPDYRNGGIYRYVFSSGVVNQYMPDHTGVVTSSVDSLFLPAGLQTESGDFLKDYMGVQLLGWGGNSGSPIVNDRGELVGIFTTGYRAVVNLQFGVPVSEIKRAGWGRL